MMGNDKVSTKSYNLFTDIFIKVKKLFFRHYECYLSNSGAFALSVVTCALFCYMEIPMHAMVDCTSILIPYSG